MTSRTKPWNLQPQELPIEVPEKPVFDYEDADRTISCGLKFKTRPHRLLLWVNAHRSAFPAAKWERRTIDTVTMRTGNNNKKVGSLVVKFHSTTNLVLIQGKAHNLWNTKFSELMDMVNHWENRPEDIPSVPEPGLDNGILSLSFIDPFNGMNQCSQDTIHSDVDMMGGILDNDSLSVEDSIESQCSQSSHNGNRTIAQAPISTSIQGELLKSFDDTDLETHSKSPKESVNAAKTRANDDVVACDTIVNEIQKGYVKAVDDTHTELF